jgi:hypothetical protein
MAKKAAGGNAALPTRNRGGNRGAAKGKPPRRLVPGNTVKLKDQKVNGNDVCGIIIGTAETRTAAQQGEILVGFTQVIALREGTAIVQKPQIAVVSVPVDQVEWVETPDYGQRNEFTEFPDAATMVEHYSKLD